MLESYFKLDNTLRRLRAEPTGRYMDGFAKTLHTKGYGLWAGQAYLRAAAHLGIWIRRQGFSVTKLDKEVIREFARHLPSCRCLGKNQGIYDDAVIGARHFPDHLRNAGVVQASAPLEKSPLPTIIDGFEQWMRQHRGVCESTLTPYRSILIKLLGAVGEVPGKYNAHFLRRAVELQTSRSGRSWAKLDSKSAIQAGHPLTNDILPVSVGTDPSVALKTRKGTGFYKVPSLKGLWYRGLLSPDGSVSTLEEWFDPARVRKDTVRPVLQEWA
jgi:hypothetical protein